jgi:hypothetical protein
MKSYKTLGTIISSLLLAASFQANAATSISKSSYVLNPSSGTAAATFEKVNGASWVSESMGYMGWTHFSKWGFMDVAKGKTVTIVLDASATGSDVAGFHPGITVFYRKTNLKAADPSLQYANDHSYAQSDSINVLNAKDESTPPKLVGNIVMDYIASGYDVDGLGDKFMVDATTGALKPYDATVTPAPTTYGPYLPTGFNTTSLAKATKLSDAIPGKVTVTFTAPKTGVYQFVVGGIRPDVGSAAAVNAGKGAGNVNAVNVSITTN